MSLRKSGNKPNTSGGKLTKGINIPPQPTIPKMPEVQPPKKTK